MWCDQGYLQPISPLIQCHHMILNGEMKKGLSLQLIEIRIENFIRTDKMITNDWNGKFHTDWRRSHNLYVRHSNLIRIFKCKCDLCSTIRVDSSTCLWSDLLCVHRKITKHNRRTSQKIYDQLFGWKLERCFVTEGCVVVGKEGGQSCSRVGWFHDIGKLHDEAIQAVAELKTKWG